MYSRIILFLLLFLAMDAQAQTAVAQENVQAMFEAQEVDWVNSYKGKLGEFTDVLITLGKKDSVYRGQVFFMRSKEILHLDGHALTSGIHLEEYNQKHQRTGFWNINIQQQKLSGVWLDNTKTRGSDVEATKTNSPWVFPEHCGIGNWVRQYKGRFLSGTAELLLQKEGNYLYGHLFEVDNRRLLNFKGRIDLENDFEFTLLNNGENVGQLSGSLQGESTIHLEWVNTAGKKTKSKFQFEQELTQGCMDYADFSISYNIAYPKSKNTKFNTYIAELTEPWRIACRERTALLKRTNKEHAPHLRGVQDAYAYYRIDNFSAEMISGVIFYQSTWSNGLEEIYFNFSFEQEESLDHNHVFKKGTAQAIRGIVALEWEKSAIFKERQLKLWGEKADVDYYTLVPGGFLFYARYNPIFGHPSIFIPLEKLKPYLKS